jgi:carotenoid 1,2-hydratase
MRDLHDAPKSNSSEKFVFCSSLAEDVWHDSQTSSAYEWWYFDAVSDDGRDAVVAIFLDNFIFSPRYNSIKNKSKVRNPKSEIVRFPAVAFCFYRDGKPLYRAINELSAKEFSARTDFPACRIGASQFAFEAAPYGVRYLLDLNLNLRGGKKLKASLEWLVVERDLAAHPCAYIDLSDKHFWNLAAPRADVTGRIEIFDRANNQQNSIRFRGTGYHDHNLDSRSLANTVAEWQWGRAHFSDATAVFYRYCEKAGGEPITKLFLIREGKLFSTAAEFRANQRTQNIFGLKYARELNFFTPNAAQLIVRQKQIVDASFFYLRFLSEINLDFGDGKQREILGITEHLAPRSLNFRWLDWLVNMRIGRNGKGAFLP